MPGVRRLWCVVSLSLTIGVVASSCHKKTMALRESPPSPLAFAGPARPAFPPPPPLRPPAVSSVDAPKEGQTFAPNSSLEEVTPGTPLLEDVFFDYNESAVRDDARTSLQKDAEWLKRWSRERGSNS